MGSGLTITDAVLNRDIYCLILGTGIIRGCNHPTAVATAHDSISYLRRSQFVLVMDMDIHWANAIVFSHDVLANLETYRNMYVVNIS